MKITKMRVDYMENPVGFDFVRPSLGWVTEAPEGGSRQASYRIWVWDAENPDKTLWDSGVVSSDQSVGVRLEMALSPRTRYFWRVEVTDDLGNACASEPAFFETGRYGEAWTGRFVGSRAFEYPQLRRSFTLDDKTIKSARVYATAAGLYCLFANGKRVGEDVLAPFFNAYDKWLQYQTYDVTPLVKSGENVLFAYLGNGYYKGRVNWPGVETRRRLYGDELGLLAELIVTYEDGTTQKIVTDDRWKAAKSPFLRSEIYDGEHFDARLLDDHALLPGYDDSAWANADVVKAPKGALTARRSVPLTVEEERPCQKVIHTPAGETVLDFGQNLSGLVRLETCAPAGTEILLEAGEVLDKHGNFYRDNMRTALAQARYVCRGGGETYTPYMTFFGFRYMRVTGLDTVRPEDFTALVLYSRMEQTGSFTCSDERVNRLFLNALWGQKGNFVDVPTDCPQRDERMGWTGDAQVFCATACLNMESDAFYRKYLYDLAQEQKQYGYVPVVIPFLIAGSGLWEFPTTAWGDAATIIPYEVYRYFGDRAILEDQYESMVGWVEYMRAQDTLGVDRYYGFHLGDWLAQDTKDAFNLFGATPTDLIATAYYALSTKIVAKTARILDKTEDAAKYEALYKRVRDSFRREYMTPNGRVVSETQTALALTLYFDLCEEDERAGLKARLKDRIEEDGMLLTTGFVGTPYLCPALSDVGLNEYAYALLLSTGRPSWLYAVERGATTIWERWNGIDENGDFGPVSMNSFNHYAYGSIAEWLYRYVCGLNPVEDAPGFKKARIAPLPCDKLGHAKASVRTQYGTFACGWALTGDTITVDVEIPFNAEATITLPDAPETVLENGREIPAKGIVRGKGVWRYAYVPTGETIHATITKKVIPRF